LCRDPDTRQDLQDIEMNRQILNRTPTVSMLVVYGAVALMLVSAQRFLIHDALPYIADYGESTFSRYWEHRWWLLVHIAGGTIALLCGPLQLWSGLRRRARSFHRWTGRAYMIGIAFAATSSFYLVFFTQPDFGAALFVLALMWWLTIAMGYVAIRNGRTDAHREWMIRSYIITFSFVSFRFIVPMSIFDGLESGRAATALWISWVVPYMVAEVFMAWKRVTRPATSPRSHRSRGSVDTAGQQGEVIAAPAPGPGA
jgi:uncharacterized membrane protein